MNINAEGQEVDLDVGEDGEFDIEIEDDTPEADKGRPRRAEDAPAPVVSEDDDIKQYSESVQKRVKRLKYDYHEERRGKEEATREREAAVKFAQNLQAENENLRKNLTDGEGVLVSQSKARVTAELAAARKAYKESHEAGDTDKMMEAQEQLFRLSGEQQRIDSWKPPVVEKQQYRPSPPARAEPQRPDEKAAEWAKKNTWFDSKNAMSRYAMLVHQELVEDGVDLKSDAYYNKIDSEMQKRYPDKFEAPVTEPQTTTRQAGSVVAPGGRTTATSRTKVTLKQSEIAIAKRLGLTNQQYAAQLIKDRQDV